MLKEFTGKGGLSCTQRITADVNGGALPVPLYRTTDIWWGWAYARDSREGPYLSSVPQSLYCCSAEANPVKFLFLAYICISTTTWKRVPQQFTRHFYAKLISSINRFHGLPFQLQSFLSRIWWWVCHSVVMRWLRADGNDVIDKEERRWSLAYGGWIWTRSLSFKKSLNA